MNEIAKPEIKKPFAFNADELPKVGDWYWVTWKGEKEETLSCISHIGSNYIKVACYAEGHEYSTDERIHFNDLLKQIGKKEEGWKAILEARMTEAQKQLADKVKELGKICEKAGLGATGDPSSGALVAVSRGPSPKEQKELLISTQKETFPAALKEVDEITRGIVGIQKSMVLPQRIQMESMKSKIKEVDERLFALELYAGIQENIYRVRKGKPAGEKEPIAIRQLMLYMDEETLIDYDKGGMDFKNLEDFDKWVAKSENADRIIPEPKCIVAMKIRRHDKDYGIPRSIEELLVEMRYHEQNKATYLLIRNGEQLWRIATAIDFGPRLIPLENEFNEKLQWEVGYDWKNHCRKIKEVTKEDVVFDDAMNERMKHVRHYNRTMFLVQGLLDRSSVFHPHPPINLGHQDDCETWLRLIRDEEKVLPHSHPPSWEEYRDKANAIIKKGSWVHCRAEHEVVERYNSYAGTYTVPKHSVARPPIVEVESVSRDRKFVSVRWPKGHRTKVWWELDTSRPVPNKPGYYYQSRKEQVFEMQYSHQRVPINQCFAVEAYHPGDYKRFLCDRYLKGAYLEWAPQLLNAEKWHLEEFDQERAGGNSNLPNHPQEVE